jgi:hypothetical protein
MVQGARLQRFPLPPTAMLWGAGYQQNPNCRSPDGYLYINAVLIASWAGAMLI